MALLLPRPSMAEPPKLPVYGHVSLGFGQNLLFGSTRATFRDALGGGFTPGLSPNLAAGFSVAPAGLMGLGVGLRIRGSFGMPVTGDGGDDYIFNHYNLALTTTYYPISRLFDDGLYVRASLGFGQLTSKRMDEARALYVHQYALGVSAMGAVGFTLPFSGISLSAEIEFDYSSRNGTVDGLGDRGFATGQLAGNLVLSL